MKLEKLIKKTKKKFQVNLDKLDNLATMHIGLG